MPAPSIATLAHAVAAASDLSEALRALRTQLDESGKGLTVSYYRYDGRRQVVCERYVPSDGTFACEPFQVSLDHLPTKLRRELIAGSSIVDFGEQSPDFMRFFGMTDPTDAYLLMQGVRANGDLCGLVAVREPRQRFGSRVVDRVVTPVAIFAVAATLLGERSARKEAEESLEQILGRVHDEHAQALAALQRELDAARRQLTADGADARMAELQRAAQEANERARGTAARLQAVEEQVANAVAQLEKAHVDLSRQSETLRNQGNLLHRLQRLLTESTLAADPHTVLEEVRAAVTAER